MRLLTLLTLTAFGLVGLWIAVNAAATAIVYYSPVPWLRVAAMQVYAFLTAMAWRELQMFAGTNYVLSH